MQAVVRKSLLFVLLCVNRYKQLPVLLSYKEEKKKGRNVVENNRKLPMRQKIVEIIVGIIEKNY